MRKSPFALLKTCVPLARNSLKNNLKLPFIASNNNIFPVLSRHRSDDRVPKKNKKATIWYVYIYINLYMYLYVFVYIRKYIHKYLFIYKYVHICICTRKHKCIHIYKYARIYT
jgi:hypothetical protein